ncbi:hypothetical protein D554_2064 [Bordetella holmesii 30539]|uniref:Uncharacterized protein n=1 Tax=Bordetella holmesii CDC-H585-BH TaxID=1331206 RepID=A0A158M0C6_9BORD|nr:hypothetical protein D560_0645 [Bordetella holmesii ATCC 51541]AIT25320.1 hypothetical protein D558_0634 [Bordetella holmesii 44057]EWM45885.1 hypothetical protein D557_3896 [Bordetella holmesii 70147]EWM48588.1 hypothetical protein D556_0640 [Bordetella holmesii 41130]EXF86814.1 hypothetical protein D554_2064 [Bordetella holmesii 30539]KAK84220.1 hypothetical protein L503_2334 [Bordetella holmesii CDC-H809-BH]KAK86643.1 hypothetical protein L573_1393 [Bordetella holmesii H620]KAK87249.1 
MRSLAYRQQEVAQRLRAAARRALQRHCPSLVVREIGMPSVQSCR